MKKAGRKDSERFDGWWTAQAPGWAEVSDATVKRWHQLERARPRLEDAVVLRALAFGFGARSVYGEHRAWIDLKAQLEADWREAGNEAAHPWAGVRNAVKRGWIAASEVQPIEKQSTVAEPTNGEPSPMESPAETRVPGGRIDGHHA